ncbi:MAG: 3-oxoacyl-[acyl-carrier protein] reductase [Thermodesulfobacteriota bacterium]|nr:3-oxoacyl-[acyl-carrier protein] reductase [Thermodesulfobacteriota bacterium]
MEDSKVAVVTGAATGIGAACARALGAHGFMVDIHYRKSEQAARELLAELGQGFLLQGDLTKSGDIDAMVEEIKTAAGWMSLFIMPDFR